MEYIATSGDAQPATESGAEITTEVYAEFSTESSPEMMTSVYSNTETATESTIITQLVETDNAAGDFECDIVGLFLMGAMLGAYLCNTLLHRM